MESRQLRSERVQPIDVGDHDRRRSLPRGGRRGRTVQQSVVPGASPERLTGSPAQALPVVEVEREDAEPHLAAVGLLPNGFVVSLPLFEVMLSRFPMARCSLIVCTKAPCWGSMGLIAVMSVLFASGNGVTTIICTLPTTSIVLSLSWSQLLCVLATDGRHSNHDQLLQLTRAHALDARIYNDVC